jgi:hypothetical protein
MADYTRKKLKVVYKDPAELIPYSKNARTHDSEIEFLCNSIRTYGFDASHAIGVDKDMVIIHGHGRRLAAMKLGMKEVPVIVRTDLTDAQAKAFRLADNKVSDMSGWDFDILDEELAFLKDMELDMTQFGFEDYSRFDPEEDDGEEGSAASQPQETEVMEKNRPDDTGNEDVRCRLVVESDDSADLDDLCDELRERGFSCQIWI